MKWRSAQSSTKQVTDKFDATSKFVPTKSLPAMSTQRAPRVVSKAGDRSCLLRKRDILGLLGGRTKRD